MISSSIVTCIFNLILHLVTYIILRGKHILVLLVALTSIECLDSPRIQDEEIGASVLPFIFSLLLHPACNKIS